MPCEVRKIESNIVGLSYAQESCIGILPDGGVAGDQAGGIWRPLEPNEYSDFGADIQTAARNPINASRQTRKGVVVGVEAMGGFSTDVTPTNMDRLMQGFFFADSHCRSGNKPINDNAAVTTPIVTISGGTSAISLAAGKGVQFPVGTLVKTSGFTNPANNRPVMRVTAVAADVLTLDAIGLVTEAGDSGRLETVGFQYTDLRLAFSANILTMTSVVGFAARNYKVGEWIFIGGDAAAERFNLGGSGQNAPGYARIEKVEANSITLKEPTFVPLTDTATGKTIRVFTGVFTRNEKTPTLIKRRTYQLERTLGQDDDGTQSEVLIGAVPNEYGLSLSSSSKLGCNLNFVALDSQVRTGAEGLKPGNRSETLPIEEAYNCAIDVYQTRLFVYGDAPAPASDFGYILSGSLKISNKATGLKALGVLSSFEVSVGDFEVSGELEVYFTKVSTITSIKNNADCGFNAIVAASNTGKVFDIPLISLSGGKLKVQKDTPIMLPVSKQAAECANGYTMSLTSFSYLPNVAMP